uniref:Protein NDUFAF4 homolog n=1 Tax=Cacopsylla melanoneura TaxID=428564 RepID=A0A8D8UR89_9HEMI
MGNIISNSSRYLLRKTRRFNVDNRAQRFIEQDKLPVAPKHPSTVKLLESITNDPKVREELMRKETVLDENLKQVYVKSLHKPVTNDDQKEQLRKNKLPQERRNVPSLQYGHTQPIVVPKGKYSFSQVIDMLAEHINDPMLQTPAVLAEKYSLDVKLVESLILYFKLFNVQMAKEADAQKLVTRQVMSTFAKLEDDMSKQTVYKLATEGDEPLAKQFENLLKKDNADERIEKDHRIINLIPDTDHLLKTETTLSKEKEQNTETKSDVGVYKNVAHRKRKKTVPK